LRRPIAPTGLRAWLCNVRHSAKPCWLHITAAMWLGGAEKTGKLSHLTHPYPPIHLIPDPHISANSQHSPIQHGPTDVCLQLNLNRKIIILLLVETLSRWRAIRSCALQSDVDLQLRERERERERERTLAKCHTGTWQATQKQPLVFESS